MTRRPPVDDRRRYQARRLAGAAGTGPRPEPRAGPRSLVTPVRVTLGIALVGGLAFLAYSVIVRDQLQIPLMTSGLAIVGIVLAVMAVMAVTAVVRAGREGHDARAVLTALAGGLFAIGAFLAFAGAVIMALIWGGTTAS